MNENKIPLELCQCGCGNRAPIAPQTNTRRGQVKGEPLRYIVGHHRRKAPVQYIRDTQTGCWIWQWYRDRRGYGYLTSSGKTRPAHVAIYELLKGLVPEGLELDHLCRTPACVNPDHMEPVTHAVNVQRGKKAKLTSDDVEAIRHASNQGVGRNELSAIYHVCPAHISRIVHNHTWKK